MPGGSLFMTFLSELPRRIGRVTSSGSYVPEIDGLRFLAIMPVLFFHAGLRGARISSDPIANEALLSVWLPMGGLGVSLFFFISGYIISYPFLSNRAPQLSHFYKRRLLRLEPPYIAAMLGCFIVLSLYTPSRAPNFDFTQAPLWQSLIASLTYTHGIIFGQSPKLNPPAWSLEREMQFYLIAPFVIHAYLRTANQRTRILLGAAICVALLVLGEVIKNELARENPLRHTLMAESYGFFAGILVCDWSLRTRPFEQRAMRRFDLPLVLGYFGLLVTGLFDGRIEDLSAVNPELAVAAGIANSLVRAGCIVAVFVGAARGEIGRRVLSWPWLTLIGGSCYSIYLVHLPLMHFGAEIIARLVHLDSLLLSTLLCWTVLIPGSIAAGLLFYVLVERPCMRPDWPRAIADAFRARHHRLHSPPLPTPAQRPDPTAAN